MNIRHFEEDDLLRMASVASRGPVLLPRRSHVIDSSCWGPIARDTLKKAREGGSLCPEGIMVAEDNGRILGFCSATVDNSSQVGQIRWMAVEESEKVASTARALFEKAIGFARDRGCRSVQVAGSHGCEAGPLLEIIEELGFKAEEDDRKSILMGRSLEDLPRLPELSGGYWAHTFRPGDEDRWLEVRNEIFESKDEPGRFEQLYSGRSTFHPDEVVFVEHEDELIGICAGVVHNVIIDGQEFWMSYLDWVGVKPGNRGHRLGEYVCLHCIHYMKRRGQKYCTLTTQPWRVPAVKLYLKLGFEIIAAQKTYELPLQ